MIGSHKNMIEEMIGNSEVSIISSVDDEGFPNVKAMLRPRHWNGIKKIYYMTHYSTMRVKHYLANEKAGVYFFDQKKFCGAMLIGTVEVLRDMDSKKLVWRDGDELYHPKGILDPDCCVLKFRSRSGRFYSNFRSENFEIE